MSDPHRFHVALTNDFYDAEGRLKYRDIGLALLEADPAMTVHTHTGLEITPRLSHR